MGIPSRFPNIFSRSRGVQDMRLETRRRKRQRPKIDQTFPVPGIFRPPSLQAEVTSFNLYGTLRKSKTEIHNPLPSPELIEREIKFIEFDNERRIHPHLVQYEEFYRYLTPTLKKRHTRGGLSPQSLPDPRVFSQFDHLRNVMP